MTGDDYAKALLDETREELSHADSKAGLLLTGSGIAIAILGGAVASGDLRLGGLPGVVQALAVVSAVGFIGGVLMLGAAIYPRVGRQSSGHARYFMDHAAYEDLEKLRQAIEQDATAATDRHVMQLRDVSRIVRRKYRLTQAAMITTGVGLLAVGGALLLHVILRH